MTFRIGSLYLMIEILLGESLFAWSCPRRNHFWIRLPIALCACLLLAYFFPFFEGISFSSVYLLLRVFLDMCYSFFAILLCFDIKPLAVLTIVASGDALQHIGSQLLTFVRYLPLDDFSIDIINNNTHLFEFLFCFAVYIIGFFVFGIPYWKKKYYEKYDWRLAVISAVAIFISIGLNRVINLIPGQQSLRSIASVVLCIMCCILALIIEFSVWESATLHSKNIVLSYLLKEEAKHFEESKAIMVTLNKRGHDLKHLLQDYEGNLPEKYLDSVRQEVSLYESRFITNNPNLDVLLTNIHYKYGKLGVNIKFVGDTSLVSFMDEMDMIVLFDNALGNAVAAVLKVEQEKRRIEIVLDKKGDMVSLLFINYFDGTLPQIQSAPLDLKADDSLFEHGIGLSSMQSIAKKYNGNINYFCEDDLFHLNVYLFDKEV